MSRSNLIAARTRRSGAYPARVGRHPFIIMLAAVCASCAGAAWWFLSQPNWSQLSPAERETLAPLVYYWEATSGNERRYFRALAADAALAAPEARERLTRNLEFWYLRSDAERAQARAAYLRFQALPPEERDRLIERWEAEQAAPAAMTPTDEGPAEGLVEQTAAPDASNDAAAAEDVRPAARTAGATAAAGASEQKSTASSGR